MYKKYEISNDDITNAQHKMQFIKDYRVGLNVHQRRMTTSLVPTASLRRKPTEFLH